ncbi:MerR family transcriptional regulator [Duganella callida]|uniref:MerR family transcriptional regulator n=1 Tax=Duganella callida TaxID=2561932 RepID=A0A4Y9S9K5_9BURK|nr:MerR family transcriptional regulator [Duganella callida]TFW17205.1 MerR family transcriptional regulator [Duganella callida]
MRIGALARAAAVSVRTLRHYESQGLIAAQRGANGYREFSTATIEQVRWIRELLDCGFSTRQIAGMMHCLQRDSWDAAACEAGYALHQRKLAELDQMISVLQERRVRLAERLAHFYSA